MLSKELAAEFEGIVMKQTAVCIAVSTLGAGKVITPKLANAAKECCDSVSEFNRKANINPKKD